MYQLAAKINWPLFNEAFRKHYSEKMGAPSKPIRLMVSLLILKYVRNLSDENRAGLIVSSDISVFTNGSNTVFFPIWIVWQWMPSVCHDIQAAHH